MELNLLDGRSDKGRIQCIRCESEPGLSVEDFRSRAWGESWRKTLPAIIVLRLATGREGGAVLRGRFPGARERVRKGVTGSRGLFLIATGVPAVDRRSIENNPIATPRYLVNCECAVGEQALIVNLMRHYSELAYGCCPSSATRAGVATVRDRLRLSLKGARRLRMQPGTLTSTALGHRALGTVEAIDGESQRIAARNGEAGNGPRG
ncbi:hypothetical protein [Arhodomonas sp. AD133]|uniref:hypothetical protein n=1 Tax=Arhodomonas sp. AD133 TaxID=3415009 RepID=UPI003EBCFA48